MLTTQQNRIMDDLISVERSLRFTAEGNTRQLLALLPEIASHLDGIRYEEMRKQDPSIPGRWSPDDWRTYFISIPVLHQKNGSWGLQKEDTENIVGIRKAAEQIAELTAALAAEKRKVETLVAENNRLHANQPGYEHKEKLRAPVVAAKDAKAARPVIDENISAPREPSSYPGMLADFKEFMKNISATPPHDYKNLGENNRPWKRYAGFIYLIGRHGINSKQELMRLMGDEENIGGNSSSLINILENLRDYGYLISDVLEIEGAEMKIAFWRLSLAGQVMFQKITGSAPVECEWSRGIRLRDGERFTSFTSTCLTFAFHARKRGWGVQVLPKFDGIFEPDIMIQRGAERVFVMLNLNFDDKPALYRHLADANRGFVPLCAANAEQRARLVEDCKLLNLPGKATDIQAMSAIGYSNVHANTEIWVETW